MIDTVEKMKEDGYYLVRHFEDSGLAVEEVSCGQLYCNGDYYSFDSIHIYWIADEPLDLEQLLANYNSSVDLNKRLGDAIAHVKGLSKEEFAQDIFDAGYATQVVMWD